MIDQETKACLLEMLAVCKGMGRIKDGKTMWEGSPIKDPECCELWERLNDVLHTANRLAGGEQWGAPETETVKALASATGSDARPPKRIWLQWDGDATEGSPLPMEKRGEVTWCGDKIFKRDVMYIRSDCAKRQNEKVQI